jgi:phage shock protein PspC (stress-responsive transcriptional regulator)
MIKQKINHLQKKVLKMNDTSNSNINLQQNGVSSSTAPGQPGNYVQRIIPPNQGYGGTDQQHYHYQPYKKFYRSTTNKWVGGVCGGLAKYFNKDPVLIRILWVVITLLSFGAGVIGYILFWLFVDKEPVQFIETRQYTTKSVNGSVHVHHHYRPSN